MQNKIHPAIAALIVVAMISLATVAVANLKDQTAQDTLSSDTTTVPTPAASDGTPSNLKNGTYTAEGTYSTPGGTESIGLTVTLNNGIIEDVSLNQLASGGDTAIYQAKFASGYKPLVQGKKIDEVKLDRVSGSSLTSDGFNRALESVKRDAAS